MRAATSDEASRLEETYLGQESWLALAMSHRMSTTSKDQILCFILSLISLRFSFTRETDRQKNWAVLQKFNSWMIKLTKTPILTNCQVANGYFAKHDLLPILTCRTHNSATQKPSATALVNKEGRSCPHISTRPSRFSELPLFLQWVGIG